MTEIFIDTSVFISYLSKDENYDKAEKVFNLIEKSEIKPITSDFMINEVVFKIMMFELFDLGAKNVHSAKKMFTKGVNLKRSMKTFTFFGELLKYNLSILNFTLTPENLMLWKRIIEDYRLFPTDALIAATCKHYSIKKIATFDTDFKRVDFLEVITQE